VSLLRNYIFWKYERGSFHYDVMVTLILAFIFISPHFIDFKDRPVPPVPLRSSEVLVKAQHISGNEPGFIYEIRAEDLHGATSAPDIRNAILGIVQPIAGDVTLENYTPIRDTSGHIIAYDATILR
jgi:hypothetical protein